MSENSGNGSFGSWGLRQDGDELVATSPNGTIELRGHDMAELETKRSQTFRDDLAAVRQALADYSPSGYPLSSIPPP